MRWRLTQNDVSNRVNVEHPFAVCRAVRRILEQRYLGTSFYLLEHVFSDIERLFRGGNPDYHSCDTPYHDLRHTLDMTLAMARLIDGHDRSCPASEQLGPDRALIGVIAALFHDSGYIREKSDTHTTQGAEYTLTHVSRSASFLGGYLHQLGLGDKVHLGSNIIHFTGYELEIDKIPVSDFLDRRLGHMLGTADLLGQMSDRLYLEKCRDFLYEEFLIGGVARKTLPDGTVQVVYASPEDLLSKTPQFYQTVACKRLNGYFDSVHRFAEVHFQGRNLYLDEIERHLSYLKLVLEKGDFGMLRRRSVTLSNYRTVKCDEKSLETVEASA